VWVLRKLLYPWTTSSGGVSGRQDRATRTTGTSSTRCAGLKNLYGRLIYWIISPHSTLRAGKDDTMNPKSIPNTRKSP